MADLTITAASVLLSSGRTDTGTAGATITAGQAVYIDATDSNKLKLAQADGTAAEVDAVGIALHAALTGQPLRYAVDGTTINIGATTAKNTTYVVSTVAGGVAPSTDLTSGHRIVNLGYATATTGTFILNIRNHGTTV
jgi:predicted cupin superfamily sugar epimerase